MKIKSVPNNYENGPTKNQLKLAANLYQVTLSKAII